MVSPKILGLALVSALGLSAMAAKAALILTLTESGYSPQMGTVSSSGMTDTYTGGLGDFTTTIAIGQTNSPAPGTLATLQLLSLNVVSNAPANTGPKTLTISLTDSGFTAPGTVGQLMLLDSSLGGSLVSPVSTDRVKFTATATPNGGIGASNGQQMYVPTNLTGTSSSFNIPGGTATFTDTSGFTINETIVLTLTSPNESANLSGSATVAVAPVPEPVTGSIAVVAAMGLLTRRRRSTV